MFIFLGREDVWIGIAVQGAYLWFMDCTVQGHGFRCRVSVQGSGLGVSVHCCRVWHIRLRDYSRSQKLGTWL